MREGEMDPLAYGNPTYVFRVGGCPVAAVLICWVIS